MHVAGNVDVAAVAAVTATTIAVSSAGAANAVAIVAPNEVTASITFTLNG